MSGPVKKRAMDMEESDSGASEGGADSDAEADLKEEIQVDFEGRSPVDSDYHGIKQLLQQLFLKAHINISDLADLIIGQNFIGSVVKQSDVDEEDDDDDDDSQLNVFGVTTVVNITEKKEMECVSQLRTLLSELCTEHGTDKCTALVNKLLSDDSKHLGLIINERFINIPSQISVPLLESLHKEIKKACEKKQAYTFDYYIFICKLHKMDVANGKKKKNRGTVEEVIWSNAEESIIDSEAECSFEFCVKGESDNGAMGEWDEDDGPLVPYRRVLFLPASKLEPTIHKIKEQLAAP